MANTTEQENFDYPGEKQCTACRKTPTLQEMNKCDWCYRLFCDQCLTFATPAPDLVAWEAAHPEAEVLFRVPEVNKLPTCKDCLRLKIITLHLGTDKGYNQFDNKIKQKRNQFKRRIIGFN